MGNCLPKFRGRKKRKSSSHEPSPLHLQGQPRVSLWVENSDFSSIPDLEQFGERVEQRVEEERTYRPHPSSLALGIHDGYSTAPEDLSEEEDQQPILTDIQIDKDSRLSSEYMTSDEADAARKIDEFEDEPSWKTAIKKTLEAEDEETPQLSANADERPLNSLATPVQLNLLSPKIVEALADDNGRLKKKRVQRYLELRQEVIG